MKPILLVAILFVSLLLITTVTLGTVIADGDGDDQGEDNDNQGDNPVTLLGPGDPPVDGGSGGGGPG